MKWNELPDKTREQFIAKRLKRVYLERASYYQAENGKYVMVI